MLEGCLKNTANIEIQRKKKDEDEDKDCSVSEHNRAGRAAHAICQRAVNHSSAMRGISCAPSRATDALKGHRRSISAAVASPLSLLLLLLLTFTLHHAHFKMKTCAIFGSPISFLGPAVTAGEQLLLFRSSLKSLDIDAERLTDGFTLATPNTSIYTLSSANTQPFLRFNTCCLPLHYAFRPTICEERNKTLRKQIFFLFYLLR